MITLDNYIRHAGVEGWYIVKAVPYYVECQDWLIFESGIARYEFLGLYKDKSVFAFPKESDAVEFALRWT